MVLGSIQILSQVSKCQSSVEYTETAERPVKVEVKSRIVYEQFPLKRSRAKRRYWLVADEAPAEKPRPRVYEDEKDENLKNKISTLVHEIMYDTQKKMKGVEMIKRNHREEPAYKAGFILSLVKKSKSVLDELFNVAIKHREKWLALEQLKIFELIVHTNVDTTNLLRQLVDIHVKHMNATQIGR